MRIVSSVALALLFVCPPLAAQDAVEPTQVYLAYYKLNFADMEDWTAGYHKYAVPALEELKAEGVITGYGVWQHNTGGEYNWRFAARATDWAKFDTFWSEYLSRWSERAGEEADRYVAMIEAHKDEIWGLSEVQMVDEPEGSYLYDSHYQISFTDMEEWNKAWAEVVAPVLGQAMEDGILEGWARLSHNTGPRFNVKVLYLFENWDHMDDMFGRVIAAVTGDAERWQQIGGMIDAHDDVIWAAVPEPSGN